VSRSGYYEWRDRPVPNRARENELLVKYIEQIHADSRGTYGSPRVHAEFTLGLGLSVNRKRVERLMCQAGIQGLCRRRRSWTTVRDPAAEPPPDLVNRHFRVEEPDRIPITAPKADSTGRRNTFDREAERWLDRSRNRFGNTAGRYRRRVDQPWLGARTA
jgi:hypothetical protein